MISDVTRKSFAWVLAVACVLIFAGCSSGGGSDRYKSGSDGAPSASDIAADACFDGDDTGSSEAMHSDGRVVESENCLFGKATETSICHLAANILTFASDDARDRLIADPGSGYYFNNVVVGSKFAILLTYSDRHGVPTPAAIAKRVHGTVTK